MSRPNPPSNPSLTRNALRVRARADLKAVETRHKHESAVVVKDPIAMKYYRLRPDEYFVLRSLDGQASLEQIQKEYQRRFAPHKVTARGTEPTAVSIPSEWSDDFRRRDAGRSIDRSTSQRSSPTLAAAPQWNPIHSISWC